MIQLVAKNIKGIFVSHSYPFTIKFGKILLWMIAISTTMNKIGEKKSKHMHFIYFCLMQLFVEHEKRK
jgi:hypothetical protein